ncbi:transposon Ty3-I Gag-Pol polyprotein [Trichonephila clavipes]|nr:transposon Ty3-I Gag-Pol polyprotein [Trichonephila clavipes]
MALGGSLPQINLGVQGVPQGGQHKHVESSVVDYVFELINRMKGSQELAILHMEDAKQKQKLWYDRRTVKRQFQLGKLVLVIAPSRPNKLSVQWVGPGEIVQQLSESNYVVKFPKKNKAHVYLVNMLKPYHQREENINLLCINPLKHDKEEDMPSLDLENEMSGCNLFSNIPGYTDLAEHDIELESERAIVAKPCRMSPRKIEILKSEVNNMLELTILKRTVKLKTQSCTLIRPIQRVFPLEVSGNDVTSLPLQKVQQTDSSMNCPNPDTLKDTEKPQVTRCGHPVKEPDKMNLLTLTDVFD